MKLTKSQLKQIIKEEIEEAMLEAGTPPWHAVGKSPEDPRMVVKPGCKRSEREALEMCADHPTDECVTANMECDEPGTAPHEPTGAQQSPWKARRSDRKDPWGNHPMRRLKGPGPGEDLTARELYRGLEETGRTMGRTPWEGKSQLKQIIKEEIEKVLETFPNPEFRARAQAGHSFAHAGGDEKCRRVRQEYNELAPKTSYGFAGDQAMMSQERLLKKHGDCFSDAEKEIAGQDPTQLVGTED